MKILKLDENALLPTSIDNTFTDFEDVLIFPNPTNEVLNISLNVQIQKVSIYNVQLITDYNNNLNKINIGDLAEGIYLLNISLENGQTKGYKIIKE